MLYIKNLLVFLLVIFSMFNCQGNKTKSDALKTSVTKFKDSLGTLENELYIPEKYIEVKTDTILSNGFSISIKTYTNMKRFVTIKYKMDPTLTQIDKYRDWVSEVKIKKNNQLIFDKTLDANFFLAHDSSIKDSLSKAINNKVWLNEDVSTEKNQVYLIGGFIFPNTDKLIYYDIKIDSKGDYSLERIK